MGFEIVELVMMLEDEFNICLKIEDTADASTPALLAESIYIDLRKKGVHISECNFAVDSAKPCLTQAQFYRLWSQLISQFGIPRNEIKPRV